MAFCLEWVLEPRTCTVHREDVWPRPVTACCCPRERGNCRASDAAAVVRGIVVGGWREKRPPTPCLEPLRAPVRLPIHKDAMFCCSIPQLHVTSLFIGHYRKPWICRVSKRLQSAKFRALGKQRFCRVSDPKSSPNVKHLATTVVCQVSQENTRQRAMFPECRRLTLGKQAHVQSTWRPCHGHLMVVSRCRVSTFLSKERSRAVHVTIMSRPPAGC